MRQGSKIEPFLRTFCGVAMGMSVVFGSFVGMAYISVAYVTFFHEPFPCKIYLENRKYFDEELVAKGRPYIPESFFQAKVRIIGSPIGPVGGYKNRVKVVEVLEGASPGSDFMVHYSATPGHLALPKDHKKENFYYIMGGVQQSGEVVLFSTESSFARMTLSNYVKPHWTMKWFYELLSECESV